MSRSLPVVLALALLSLAVAAPAHAVLYTVNFMVTGDLNDPVNAGLNQSGSFSFDSSIIPPGGGTVHLPATSISPGTARRGMTGTPGRLSSCSIQMAI
jgi:hypothetical protein